jgi:hypothetical protein
MDISVHKKRLWLILFATFMFLTGMCYTANACTCEYSGGRQSMSERVASARERSIGVFVGTVTGEVSSSESSYFTRYKFRVIRAWKGVESEEVTVSTGTSGTLCGFSFELGGTYLVYAFGTTATGMGTNRCQRTTPFSENTEDLKYLGEPKYTWPKAVGKIVDATTFVLFRPPMTSAFCTESRKAKRPFTRGAGIRSFREGSMYVQRSVRTLTIH